MHKTVRPHSTDTQYTALAPRLRRRKKRAAKRPVSKLCGIFRDLPDLPLERFLEAKTIWRTGGRVSQ
jgi:hypothetical protein